MDEEILNNEEMTEKSTEEFVEDKVMDEILGDDEIEVEEPAGESTSEEIREEEPTENETVEDGIVDEFPEEEIFDEEFVENEPVKESVVKRKNPFTVISKVTFGEYKVRDIQQNSSWGRNPYEDYAAVLDNLVESIMETKGFVDIVLNEDGTEVVSFTALEIPDIPVPEVETTEEELQWQAITDLEIAQMEYEQALTDLEIEVLNNEQNK